MLDAIPLAEREAVNRIWSTFSASSHANRGLILKGILTICCFSQLSLLSQELHNIIRLDPFAVFPAEISLRILSYLDAFSLGRAAQVSRRWRALADDDVLWKGMCVQHINTKCAKCGWGLPLLKKLPLPASYSRSLSESTSHKRSRGDAGSPQEQPLTKRQRTSASSSSSLSVTPSTSRESTPQPSTPSSGSEFRTRPWKNVYCERLNLERNWRAGRFRVRTLKGHLDGVACLQYAEHLSTVKYPILITGSYDHTVRVWNMAEDKEVLCITGHTRAIRALQFDDLKLITGSMDSTLRIWNWRTGECVRELRGHSAGVVSLNYDTEVLVSGSVDTTIRVWPFRSKDSFVLRGHLHWVNSVLLWDDPFTTEAPPIPNFNPDGISAGKMLFSASDDGTVRLWDLASRACTRLFAGHKGQIQTLKLLMVDRSKVVTKSNSEPSTDRHAPPGGSTPHPYNALPSGMPGFAPANVSIPSPPPSDHPGFTAPQFAQPDGFDPTAYRSNPNSPPADVAYSHIKSQQKFQLPIEPENSDLVPILLSGSLDNTLRVWDVTSGKEVNTLFGHIEGIWAVAADKLRVVSGSHDRTIKIWERETGNCQTTLVGHSGAVTCLALCDDKIISGSDDKDVKVWDFSPKD
jgi:F-box and WD-40 domain protein MET30